MQNSNNDSPRNSKSKTSLVDPLARHLTLIDLISIGVGGTIGSGIFVLCGIIASDYAGPSSILSWIIGGIAAFCSGCCYAELAILYPTGSGSTYIFVYHTMGEFMGLLAACCLSLEYVVCGAAVARSWGDKLYLALELKLEEEEEESGFNAAAMAISIASVIILYLGIRESKLVTNITTFIKILLVLFMIIGGFCFFNSDNLKPFFPMGIQGALRGSTSSFFGYLGYDEVCCFTGEAIQPHKNMPRAVLWTIGIVTLLYCGASLALVGMQPYEEIVGFAEAFRYNGYEYMAQITAWGEIITLPIVVLLCLMAQPRILYAVAKDGLLPKFLSKTSQQGNLNNGIFVSGFIMISLSAFVPFTYLNDFISAGILVAFSMTDSALLLQRHSLSGNKNISTSSLRTSLFLFNLLSFSTGLSLAHISNNNDDINWIALLASCILGITTISSCVKMDSTFFTNNNMLGNSSSFQSNNDSETASQSTIDNSTNSSTTVSSKSNRFMTPFIPYLPCAAIFLNWILVAQLETLGIFLLFLYLGVVAFFYFLFKCFLPWFQSNSEKDDEIELHKEQDDENTRFQEDDVLLYSNDNMNSTRSSDSSAQYFQDVVLT